MNGELPGVKPNWNLKKPDYYPRNINYMIKNNFLNHIANRTQNCNRSVVWCSLFITTLYVKVALMKFSTVQGRYQMKEKHSIIWLGVCIQFERYLSRWWLIQSKPEALPNLRMGNCLILHHLWEQEEFDDTKWQSESLYRRRTVAKRKSTKGQTTIYKT
jgi:hypothetical protein